MSLLLQTKLMAETLHEHVGLCQALENVSMAVRGSKNTSVNEAIAERKENVSSLRDDLLSVLRGLRKVRESEQEEEREDSISTRFMVGDLSAYCKGQYATRSKNTTRSPGPVPTPESKSGIAVETFL